MLKGLTKIYNFFMFDKAIVLNTNLIKGDLIKFKDKYSSSTWYVKIDGFYDINEDCGGGIGISYTMLAGTGSGHTPASFFEKIKKFKTIGDMQQDIDNNLRDVY